MDSAEHLKEKLLEKSREAFILAIEIYNKPSIKYRIEGFSFFICNAWELMLKAHIVNKFGEAKIYYKDNPNRTITLENCMKLLFTNERAPLRKNLNRIVELRNTSTHFIVEEYEMVYIPLFQSCIFNFIGKMEEFHQFDMTSIVPQNFLTLTVSMRPIDITELRAKYPNQVAERLISTLTTINDEMVENNSSYSIRIEHLHYVTKKRDEATEVLYLDKSAEHGIQIVKELKDPNNSFNFTTSTCIKEINTRLSRDNTDLIDAGNVRKFNTHHFDLFVKYFNIKENSKLCFTYNLYKNPSYGYSIQAVEFIVDEIKKDPENIIGNMKKHLKK